MSKRRHSGDAPSRLYTPRDATIKMRLEDTPYGDDPDNADELYLAIGRYFVAWSRFEGHFLGCLLTIRTLPHAPFEKSGFPISWKKRADYWRQAFREMPQLQPL